jgi:membrane-associated phospholipid phosphatase
MAVVLLGTVSPIAPLLAQDSSEAPSVQPTDALLLTTGVAAWLVPTVWNWRDGPSSCAPCDPESVPFFDRWTIHEPNLVWDGASDLVGVGVMLASILDLATAGRAGGASMLASIESFVWAEAVTHLAKAAVGRKRPILYTDLAAEVAAAGRHQRSMPSGHTAGAFAFATSYWLSRSNVTEDDKPWLRWIFMAGATTVGVLRVAAGKHYPSDVLVGAAVGVASAVVIHTIRF